MSNTPEADFESGLAECQNTKADDRVPAEFARQLERQRNDLLAALEELRDAKWLNLPGRAGDIVEAAIAKAKEAA